MIRACLLHFSPPSPTNLTKLHQQCPVYLLNTQIYFYTLAADPLKRPKLPPINRKDISDNNIEDIKPDLR